MNKPLSIKINPVAYWFWLLFALLAWTTIAFNDGINQGRARQLKEDQAKTPIDLSASSEVTSSP